MPTQHRSHGVHSLTDLQDTERFLWKERKVGAFELPMRYGRSHVTLIARDPDWVYAYWECESKRATLALFRHDPESRESAPVFQTDVAGVGSYYIPVPSAGDEYAARITDEGGNAFESRPVKTPPGRLSDVLDIGWLSIDEVFMWEPFEFVDASSPGMRLHGKKRLKLDNGSSYSSVRR